MLSYLRTLMVRISATFMRDRLDRQLSDEFEAHLALLTERLQEGGFVAFAPKATGCSSRRNAWWIPTMFSLPQNLLS
jgi:hypothetical protein